ncbi:Golgi to ER traffic protein 4 homolog [Agrilus planipennis]|uniref:Golgi to ER traffic protein 4 homolog n=1 Tax=Agrilus planipennis TaxID=224129 RepID=A0A1W4WIC0_AGRPL|nr:Golgi to ER traffic protein 4 homolog [Agrilus planipennis]
MASSNARGVSRVLEKLENSVKEGNYYEAHQMYRTLYFRYLGQEKYNELLDMLYNGAVLFLDRNQHISGADLAILLVDVLVKSENGNCTEWIPKICKIFGKIDPSIPERDTFINSSIRWSAKNGSQGHPLLHQGIAQVYWNEKSYAQARHHFMYSKDGQSCAKLLIEIQTTQGYQGEIDLFIAQTVLQYLCLRNKNTANQTFSSYTKEHPRIRKSGPPYLLPLLNFLWFLLQTIESKKLTTFAVLCAQYEPSIKRDPCYVQYLDKIGQIFFGLKPPVQQGGGFFGNFLQSFLSGLDEDSDEEQLQTSASSSSSSSKMPKQLMHTEDLD